MTGELRERAHNSDVTVWVGKGGVENVVEELQNQLDEKDVVKVKFLRAARGTSGTDELAVDLAARADADLLETRGNTAVYY